MEDIKKEMEEIPTYIWILLMSQARQINGQLSPIEENDINEYFLMTGKNKVLYQLHAKAYYLNKKIERGKNLTTRQEIEVQLMKAGVYEPGMVDDKYMECVYKSNHNVNPDQSFERLKRTYPDFDFEKEIWPDE